MSRPVSRYLHPFDVDHHPSLEPEVKFAILASWASDRNAGERRSASRLSPEAQQPLAIHDTATGLHRLKGKTGSRSLQ